MKFHTIKKPLWAWSHTPCIVSKKLVPYYSDFSKYWNPCEWTSIEIWRSSNKKWRPYLGYNKVEKVEKTGMVKGGIVREKNHFNLRKYHHNPYVASNATQKISKRYKNNGMVKWGIVREKKIISISENIIIIHMLPVLQHIVSWVNKNIFLKICVLLTVTIIF